MYILIKITRYKKLKIINQLSDSLNIKVYRVILVIKNVLAGTKLLVVVGKHIRILSYLDRCFLVKKFIV